MFENRPIELRYRDWFKRHYSFRSAYRSDNELVIYEIKTDFEGGSAIRDY